MRGLPVHATFHRVWCPARATETSFAGREPWIPTWNKHETTVDSRLVGTYALRSVRKFGRFDADNARLASELPRFLREALTQLENKSESNATERATRPARTCRTSQGTVDIVVNDLRSNRRGFAGILIRDIRVLDDVGERERESFLRRSCNWCKSRVKRLNSDAWMRPMYSDDCLFGSSSLMFLIELVCNRPKTNYTYHYTYN